MAKVKAFRCSRTGLFYPSDYVEQWGRKYGRGLGTVPVSEAVVNMYRRKPVYGRDGLMSHPIANCRAQVDMVEIEEADYLANLAILHIDDPDYQKRGELMHHKGMVKEQSMVSQIHPDKVTASKDWLSKRQLVIDAKINTATKK